MSESTARGGKSRRVPPKGLCATTDGRGETDARRIDHPPRDHRAPCIAHLTLTQLVYSSPCSHSTTTTRRVVSGRGRWSTSRVAVPSQLRAPMRHHDRRCAVCADIGSTPLSLGKPCAWLRLTETSPNLPPHKQRRLRTAAPPRHRAHTPPTATSGDIPAGAPGRTSHHTRRTRHDPAAGNLGICGRRRLIV